MEGPPEVDAEVSLYRAINYDQAELIKSLVQTGADPNAVFNSKTALMQACSMQHPRCVKALLEVGADPEICESESGVSPLVMCVVSRSYYECAIELIAGGADVNAVNDTGWPALVHASRAGNVEMVNVLVAANADVEQRTPGAQNTPLGAAVTWGCHACVQALIEAGAKVNATNSDKDTALMFCATLLNESCSSIKCAKTLLKAGATVDLRNANGNTALMKAVERYRQRSWNPNSALRINKKMIELLIDAGASLKNKSEHCYGYNIEGAPLYELPWMFTRRMAYLRRVFQGGVRARAIAIYWQGEAAKRQHAPGGNGRKRDRDEFVEDCATLL